MIFIFFGSERLRLLGIKKQKRGLKIKKLFMSFQWPNFQMTLFSLLGQYTIRKIFCSHPLSKYNKTRTNEAFSFKKKVKVGQKGLGKREELEDDGVPNFTYALTGVVVKHLCLCSHSLVRDANVSYSSPRVCKRLARE